MIKSDFFFSQVMCHHFMQFIVLKMCHEMVIHRLRINFLRKKIDKCNFACPSLDFPILYVDFGNKCS